MKKIKLFDAELRLMELIWQQQKQPVSAKQLSILANDEIGWNKNTTYTVIKKLVAKNAVKREEPNYICVPLISRDQVQLAETRDLINKLFEGSVKTFFSSFIKKENLTDDEISQLKDLIDKKL
ncbi:BlaI/MecI/CopY family transcriptional regulator [Clostridium sp. 'deep sea']|uniref:BlaI/MecI/CopY family transcriptional regulator n=1 Tax=Clostridium sp. 'deep sea' TaxID=2779445 RepID=UPI0018965FD8|nr:BlaI/MecI/CopY family transcriptional regulator [Clostridium sp. 'deep sea']QOR35122.1 BlaI/MecI/CopY family transcriptional regulator [Clostridium sp. 'deep sea']